MGRSGSMEAPHDVGRLEHRPGLRSHQEPGVVVDQVQDLDLGATGEPPVGDVGLPAFIRLIGLEPDERAPRALLGLGDDEAPAGKDPPDRCDRWAAAVALGEVEPDRVGPGIKPLVGQVLAELDDLPLQGLRRAMGARPGQPRPGLETGLTLCIEASDELVDPLPGEPVVAGHLRLRPPLDPDRGDHEPCHRHRPPPLDPGCKRCRETPVNYVLKPDSPGGTAVMSRVHVAGYKCIASARIDHIDKTAISL